MWMMKIFVAKMASMEIIGGPAYRQRSSDADRNYENLRRSHDFTA
jgi:hypothetical protein